MLTAMSAPRIAAAAGRESPTPVKSRRYAATHMGHLGMRARVVMGTAHWKSVAMRRRHGVEGAPGSPSLQQQFMGFLEWERGRGAGVSNLTPTLSPEYRQRFS